MSVEGSGPQGQVSGVGKLELVDNGSGGTIVKYRGEANVRGSLARVGARMIQPAAKTIVGQFFDKHGEGSRLQELVSSFEFEMSVTPSTDDSRLTLPVSDSSRPD